MPHNILRWWEWVLLFATTLWLTILWMPAMVAQLPDPLQLLAVVIVTTPIGATVAFIMLFLKIDLRH
jgi:hypothetical protein